MKKLLITGYFVSMLFLTYLTAKAVSIHTTDNVEVKYRKHERELNDSEISMRGIIPKEDKNVVEKWATKETRIKTLLGWETKIETIEQPSTWYVDCGCK